MRLLLVPLVALALAAPVAHGAARRPAPPSPVREGEAFARAHCAACHAIPPVRFSPNPESPAFADIVAQPGLTAETLRAFLTDSHNYPDVMRFEIAPDRIDALAAYMMSLRAAR